MGAPVTHWQILSKHPERTAAFYQELFDWRIDAQNALGYRMVDTRSGSTGIPGGIWPAPPEGHGMVQLFVQVPDVAAAAERAKGLGAALVIPPQKLPQGDEMAVLVDPEGLPFAVWRNAAARSKSAPS